MKSVLGSAGALTLFASALVANPGLECSVNASSQVEIGQCLSKIADTTDAALRIMLEISRKTAMELDEVTGRDLALPRLDTSQTAWEAYRKAHCDYAGALSGGGSGTGIEIQSCRIDLTRARITELQSNLP